MSYTGYQKSQFCLKQDRKISDFCLTQGQGMTAGPQLPTQGYIEYPPPPGHKRTRKHEIKPVLGDFGTEKIEYAIS